MTIAFIHSSTSLKNTQENSYLFHVAQFLFGTELAVISKQGVDLDAVISSFKQKNVKKIIISSGDGTIARIITAMAHIYAKKNFPKLIILPSGNTNLIACDIGATRRNANFLYEIAAGKAKLKPVSRYTIKLSWPQTEYRDKLGMFGGCGSYEKAVMCSRGEIEHFTPHRLAILLTILTSTLKIFFSKKERRIWYQGVKMPWKGNRDFSSFSEDVFFTLITSLHRLPYGLWPFWNHSSKPEKGLTFLRVSSFPKSFFSAVFYLISGKIPLWMKKSSDYKSGTVSTIITKLDAPFILDGEFHEPSDSGILKIELGPEIEFLV